MKSKKAIKEYHADCKKALEGYDEDGEFVGSLESDDILIHEGIIEGLEFVLNKEGEQSTNKYTIDLETDFKSIKDGECFSWTIDGVEVWVSTKCPLEPESLVTKEEQSKLNSIADIISANYYPKSACGTYSHAEAYEIDWEDEEDVVPTAEMIKFDVKYGQQDDCHNTTHSDSYKIKRDVLNKWDGHSQILEHIEEAY